MAEARVGLVIGSKDGVWAQPVPSDDLDARAWYATFVDETFEGLYERAARIAQEIFSPELGDLDVHGVAHVTTAESDPPLAVFVALSDILDPMPIDGLRLYDLEEADYLQGNTTDPALAIALPHLVIVGLRGDHRSPWGPDQEAPPRAEALGLLHERLSDDGETWTATYRCEVSGNGIVVRGPSRATPSDAVAWARELADTVLFFVGHQPGKPFNAGTQLVNDPLTGEPWPNIDEPLTLEPRQARPRHKVRYEPLNANDELTDP